MSYTPKTWATGDTITATAMNNIEQGIANAGGGTGGVIINDTSGTLDKTYAEIYDLLNSGTPCFIRWIYNQTTDLDGTYTYSEVLLPIISVYKYDATYRIAACSTAFRTMSNISVGTPFVWTYQVATSTGYPTYVGRVGTVVASLVLDTGQYV